MELRPFGEQDLGDIEALIEDPDVLSFTRIPEPPPDGFPRRWLARYEQGREDGSCEAFVIAENGDFLGLVLAPVIDREAAEVEIGYIVKSSARGRGVATHALRWMTVWAFEEVGAKRITLIIDVLNGASRKVAERCGYVCEGVMRSTHLKQGRRIDAELWSRLPGDP